jgi:hypothetical protein
MRAKVTSPSVIRSISDTGITFVENNLGTQPATIQEELENVGSAYTQMDLRVDTLESLSSAYAGLVTRIGDVEAETDALHFTSNIFYDGGLQTGWSAFPEGSAALNSVFTDFAAEILTKDITVRSQAIASASAYTSSQVAALSAAVPNMFSIPDGSITPAKLSALSPSPAGTMRAPTITVNSKGQVTTMTAFFADAWADGNIPQYSTGSSRMLAKTRAQIMGTAAEYRFYGYSPTSGDIALDSYIKYVSARIGIMLGASNPTTTLDVNGAIRTRGGAVLANDGEVQGTTGDLEFRAGETFRVLRRFNDLQATVEGAPVTAKRFERVKKLCSAALTVYFPASPTENDMLEITDGYGNAGTNNITLDGNGNMIAVAGAALASTYVLASNYVWREVLYSSGVWYCK